VTSVFDFRKRTFGRQEGNGPMGEVRARVKLTNAVDEALASNQQLPANQVRVYEAEALVDTGAVSMAIPAQVAKRLGLGGRGERVVEYADGPKEAVSVSGPLIAESTAERL
jgi:hypothetical protein